jgi:hypothetical protein
MIGTKKYLALVSAIDGKAKISETLMRTAKRMLGPVRSPLAAWPTGFLIAFQSDEPALATADRMQRELGQWFRVAVMELGADLADTSVVPQHRDWIAALSK